MTERSFAEKFNEWVNSNKQPCELCGELRPEVSLKHLTRDKDSPICCMKCFMKDSDKKAELLLGKPRRKK